MREGVIGSFSSAMLWMDSDGLGDFGRMEPSLSIDQKNYLLSSFSHMRGFLRVRSVFLKSNIKTNNHPIYRRIVMFVTILRKRVSNKYIFNGFWSNLDLQWRWAKTVQLNTLRDRLDERWDIGKICWSFWRSVLKEKTQLGIRLMR